MVISHEIFVHLVGHQLLDGHVHARVHAFVHATERASPAWGMVVVVIVVVVMVVMLYGGV